jgi:mono/diheme cytochrome c family protein
LIGARAGLGIAIAVALFAAVSQRRAAGQGVVDVITAENANGWQIAAGALDEKMPPPTPESLKKGKATFQKYCQKCHGADARGDGPDGDPQHPPADLTASHNAPGIMFYKVWNGRKAPLMPAFKTMLTRDEVWAVVQYATTLRTDTQGD